MGADAATPSSVACSWSRAACLMPMLPHPSEPLLTQETVLAEAGS